MLALYLTPHHMTLYPHEGVWTDTPVELLSLVGIVAILIGAAAGLYRHWRATECHVDGCHRHQWKLVAGTDHVVCKVHHASITGRQELGHDAIQAEHRASL